MKALLGFLLLCSLTGVFCKGTLYLNSIVGNVDPITAAHSLNIECVVFNDNEIKLDFINGLRGPGTGYGAGTTIELSNNRLGSLTIPGNLLVDGYGKVDNLTNADGGIYCYFGPNYNLDHNVFEYAFQVADNTGVTTVVGTLFPNGGITVGDNLFRVQAHSGRTEVNGLTRPDGGINVNSGLWTVRTDGYLFSQGNMTVEKDIYIGSTKSETRSVMRIESSTNTAGKTTFHGQDAKYLGGNLVLSPGFGTREFASHQAGSIYLGQPGDAGTFTVSRQAITVDFTYGVTNIDGGKTIFSGQDSASNGGDIILQAGSGTGGFSGGNIILETGLGNDNVYNIQNGNIVLGQKLEIGTTLDYNPRVNFDLYFTRPAITDASPGGDTTIQGQNSLYGVGGSLQFTAGSGGNKAGDLYLQPGENYQFSALIDDNQGTLYIGDIVANTDLHFRRDGNPNDNDPNPGSTTIAGQDSTNSNGGNLHFVSGGNENSATVGSNIYLTPGDGVKSGIIYWDTQFQNAYGTDDLYVKRSTALSAGTSTTIQGQSNPTVNGNGGNLNINAGNGQTFGGDLNFVSGYGAGGNGGGITVTAGGGSAAGGNIVIQAGGGNAVGGSVTFWSGNGNPDASPVDLIIRADSSNAGAVTFTGPTNTNSMFLSQVLFVLDQNGQTTNNLSIGGGLTITSILTGNTNFIQTGADQLIRSSIKLPTTVHEPVVIPTEDPISSTIELNNMVNQILIALKTHGLVA